MTVDTIFTVLALLCCYIGDKKDQKGWFYLAGFLFTLILGMELAKNISC
jgi:4-amino-4-deoxy-L-arabinose transferase-like glycosyltransferase